MKKARVVSTFRFLEWGKPPPPGSRFKGIINTASLIGWVSYTNRDKAAALKQEKTMHEGGLLGYTNHENDIKTYSSEGWLDDGKMNTFKKAISRAFHKNGNLCWDTVVSLRDYMDAHTANMYSLNDYAAIVSKTLPDYFKNMGLDPDNMLWWMNYHTNKKNPHMHIVFMEKNQTQTRGKLPQRMLDKYKSLWLKELGMRQEFAKAYGIAPSEFMKQKDEYRNSLLDSIDRGLSMNEQIQKLAASLPETGRLSYNSKPMKEHKESIDKITDQILLSDEVRPSYEAWLKTVETVDMFQNKLAGDDISHFKGTELEKIYTRIGNMILKQTKDIKTNVLETYDLWFNESHVQAHNDTDAITMIKIPHVSLRVAIPDERITTDDIGYRHVELNDDEKDMKLYAYDRNIQAWKQTNAREIYEISGVELRKVLENNGDVQHLKEHINEIPNIPHVKNNESSDIKEIQNEIKDARKIEKNDENIKNEETKFEKETEDTKSVYKRGIFKLEQTFGIKRTNRKLHSKNSSAYIKKGARRLLFQDQREKDKDLEKFIREIEEQKIRSEEREMI